jgi:hypothetical protein
MWYIQKYKIEKDNNLVAIGKMELCDVIPEYNKQECDLQVSIKKIQ